MKVSKSPDETGPQPLARPLVRTLEPQERFAIQSDAMPLPQVEPTTHWGLDSLESNADSPTQQKTTEPTSPLTPVDKASQSISRKRANWISNCQLRSDRNRSDRCLGFAIVTCPAYLDSQPPVQAVACAHWDESVAAPPFSDRARSHPCLHSIRPLVRMATAHYPHSPNHLMMPKSIRVIPSTVFFSRRQRLLGTRNRLPRQWQLLAMQNRKDSRRSRSSPKRFVKPCCQSR